MMNFLVTMKQNKKFLLVESLAIDKKAAYSPDRRGEGRVQVAISR
jgi:hypothetical protein